jgi:hypothetical protein
MGHHSKYHRFFSHSVWALDAVSFTLAKLLISIFAAVGVIELAGDAKQPRKKLKFDPFGLHATLLVKTRRALYYTAGGDRLLTIVLTRDATGKRPDQPGLFTTETRRHGGTEKRQNHRRMNDELNEILNSKSVRPWRQSFTSRSSTFLALRASVSPW